MTSSSDPNSASSLDAAIAPVLPMDTPSAPKFCGICGTPWQLDWATCQQCAAAAQRVVVPLEISTEQRAIKSSIALYFTLLAACAVGLLIPSSVNPLNVDLGVTIALSAITLIWCAFYWRIILPPLSRLGGLRWFAAAIGLSLPTFAIATGVITGVQHLVHLPAEKMSDSFRFAGYGWGMIILCVCVQPALIEELAFRGVIFGALQKALSPFETIMVSALMFMILHLSVPRFPHTLALGMASGFLRTRTKSLYPCMLLHFSHDFLCVAAEWMIR